MDQSITHTLVIEIELLKLKLKGINLKWIDFLVLFGFYEIEKNKDIKDLGLNSRSVARLINKDQVYVYKSIQGLLEREYLLTDEHSNPWKPRSIILSGKARSLLLSISHSEPFDYCFDKFVDDPEIRSIRKKLAHV